MQIREMQEQDIESVAKLEKQNFSCPWTAADFFQQLSNPRAYYLVAEEQGNIVGVCGYIESFQEGELYNISVDSAFQGQGIGYKMVMSLLEQGKQRGVHSFTLEVRAGNHKALALYDKLGFAKEGLRKDFYEMPKEDAIIMWKR